MINLHQLPLTGLPLVEPASTGYSTVSVGVASAEVEAPAWASLAQWSLLVVDLLPVPASQVVHNRVLQALMQVPTYLKLLVRRAPIARAATEYNTPVVQAAALVFEESEAHMLAVPVLAVQVVAYIPASLASQVVAAVYKRVFLASQVAVVVCKRASIVQAAGAACTLVVVVWVGHMLWSVAQV
jgi:hypothetical protein